ncbi:hypothetical protein AB5J72_22750 [Streptomyces sp. CG1]
MTTARGYLDTATPGTWVSALADRHEVTIVSVRRHRTQPRFDIDPG